MKSHTDSTPPALFEPGLLDEAHRDLAGLDSPSPCLSLPHLASSLGVASIRLKDESSRLGLNSFKALGVRFAMGRLVRQGTLSEGATVSCATDGNHGRAVARCAREWSLRAEVYVHTHTSRERIERIRAEGARVTVVAGNYDDAVARVSQDSQARGWSLISDTALQTYQEIPRTIMAGYTELAREASEQGAFDPLPDMILIQCGVGGLAGALIEWFRQEFSDTRPFLVVCEPSAAACALESLHQGGRVSLSGRLETSMDCLSCGQVSWLAWPLLQEADACIAIGDGWAQQAVERLRHPLGSDPTVQTAPSGAAGLAGLLALLEDPALAPVRSAAELGAHSRVWLVCTEGLCGPSTR